MWPGAPSLREKRERCVREAPDPCPTPGSRQLAAAGWVAKLAEGLRLDLADPLAAHVQLLAHFREGAGAIVLETEAELEDASLAAGQGVEDRLDLLLEELV